MTLPAAQCCWQQGPVSSPKAPHSHTCAVSHGPAVREGIRAHTVTTCPEHIQTLLLLVPEMDSISLVSSFSFLPWLSIFQSHFLPFCKHLGFYLCQTCCTSVSNTTFLTFSSNLIIQVSVQMVPFRDAFSYHP